MTEFPAAAPAPPTPAEPNPNPIARVFGALFSPGETFASIARRPDWVVPLVLIVIVSYVGTALILPRMDWDAVISAQQEQMKAQGGNVPPEQAERVARFTKAGGQVFGWVAPLFFILWYLLVAAVLLLAFRLAGGEGGFKQAFSATLYAWMPLLLNSILVTVVAVLRHGLIDPTQMATMVKSNPAFLVDLKAQPVLFALLSSIDVFTIWTVVLLIVGFAALSRSSKAKAAMIVIPLWFVCILIKLIGPAIQSLRK